MRLNVTSEIGRLKSVLVHLPGREIDLMVPPMMNQLLFDEILELQDLLEEVFEDDEVKSHIVRDLAKRNHLGRRLVRRLLEQPAATLADTLISGIPDESE